MTTTTRSSRKSKAKPGSLRSLWLVVTLAAAGVSTPALAVDYTWTGGSTQVWSLAANWGGTTPVNAASTAVFFGAPVSNRVAPNLTASATVGSIMFNSGASAFTISRNSAFTLTLTAGGSVVNNSTNLQTFTTPVVLGGASTWNTANGAMAVGGTISGAGGALTKTGTGVLTLTATNSYNGGTTISEGTLQVGTGGRLGTGGVTNNSVLQYNNASGTVIEANVISGAGSLNQIGTGTLSLTGSNSYLGGTTISAGTLQFSSTANFGSGMVGLNGGALRWATGNTADVSGILTLGSSGGILDTNGNNVTLASAIAGSGPLTKGGTGILTLNAATSATSITVAGGTLRSGAAGVLPAGVAYAVGGTASGGAATLDLNGFDLAIGTLSLGGNTNSVNTVATGAGTLTLGGNVSYVGNGAASITGKLDLGANTRTFNIADSTSTSTELSIGAVISGSVGLVKTGTGILALSGNNTYTGGTTVSGGTLQFANGSLGAGAVTVNGFYTTLMWGAGNTDGLAGGLSIAGGYARLNTNGNDVTLATAIGGSGRMTKEGAGTLTLGLNPNLTAVFVHDGTVRLSADNALPSAGNVTVVATGSDGRATLDLDGHDLSIGSLDLGAYYSGRNGINTVTTGTGTLTLGGNVTYAGQGSPYEYFDPGTAVIEGKLNLGSSTRTFSIYDSFNTNFELNVTADVSGAGGIVKTGTGNMALSGTLTYAGDTTISSGVLRANLPATSNLRMNGGVLEISADRSFVYGTGAGQIQWTGGGGGFSAYGGNRVVDIKDGGGASIDLVWGGGNFVANGSSLALSSGIADSTVTLANNIDLNGATRTVTVANGSAATDAVLGGVLSNGALTVTGDGTLKLTGSNTYAGGTYISGPEVQSIFRLNTTGAVVEFSQGSLGAGSVTLDNGSQLRWAAGNTDPLTGKIITIGSGGATLNTNGNNVSLDRGLGANTGNLEIGKAGEGTLTLNEASNFSTAYLTISGGTLRLGTEGAVGTGQFGIVRVNGQNAGGSAAFDTNNTNYSAYVVTFGGTTAQANVSNSIMTGSGTLNFSTGGAVAYTKATLAINDPGAAYLSGNLNFLLATGTFAVDDSSNAATDLTVSANISSGGNFGIAKVGAGTLELSGSNTYAGNTTLSAGTLRLANSKALSSGTLAYTGGLLELGGNNITIANSITLGNAVRTISTLDNFGFGIDATLSGTISGAGGINKTGAGTLRLSGVKTFSGSTVISAGTLLYANQTALYNNGTANWTAARIIVQSGATAAFNVGGAGEFTSANIDALKALGGATNGFRNGSSLGLDTSNAVGGNFTYASNIGNSNGGTNAIGLTKLGTGTLTLTGNNTYTGGTVLDGGTLNLGSAGAVGTSGTIGFRGGTLQYSAANTTDYSARFTSAPGQQYKIDTNGQAVTFASALTGVGAGLTKIGTGTLTLSGNNTYSGLTLVDAGTLLINGDNRGATFQVLVQGALGGSGIVGGDTTIMAGGTLSPGNSPGTLTFENDLTLDESAFALIEAGDLVDVNGTLTFADDWTLTLTSGFQDGGSTILFTYDDFSGTGLAPTFDITGLGFIPSGTLTLIDTGSSIVLNGISVVPEPTALALLVGAGAVLMGARRRRVRDL